MPVQMVQAANGDVLKVLAMLPQERLIKITEEINKTFDEMPDTIIIFKEQFLM